MFGDLTSKDFQDNKTCIVQILNCVAIRAHGLSESLSRKYPYCNMYTKRRPIKNLNRAVLQDRPLPGTLDICRPSSHPIVEPLVANLYAQYYMGKERNRNYMSWRLTKSLQDTCDSSCTDPNLLAGLLADTQENRIKWFRDALNKLLEQIPEEDIERVIFPYRIGCGLAGGNWSVHYLPAIKDFSTEASKRGVSTLIVRLVTTG